MCVCVCVCVCVCGRARGGGLCKLIFTPNLQTIYYIVAIIMLSLQMGE